MFAGSCSPPPLHSPPPNHWHVVPGCVHWVVGVATECKRPAWPGCAGTEWKQIYRKRTAHSWADVLKMCNFLYSWTSLVLLINTERRQAIKRRKKQGGWRQPGEVPREGTGRPGAWVLLVSAASPYSSGPRCLLRWSREKERGIDRVSNSPPSEILWFTVSGLFTQP